MTMTATRPSKVQSKLMKQLEDDDPTILMNIRMKKSLKKGIRLFAAEKGITITELATKALNEYMKKNT